MELWRKRLTLAEINVLVLEILEVEDRNGCYKTPAHLVPKMRVREVDVGEPVDGWEEDVVDGGMIAAVNGREKKSIAKGEDGGGKEPGSEGKGKTGSDKGKGKGNSQGAWTGQSWGGGKGGKGYGQGQTQTWGKGKGGGWGNQWGNNQWWGENQNGGRGGGYQSQPKVDPPPLQQVGSAAPTGNVGGDTQTRQP